jgi:Bacterial Ig-like domain (group 3)/Putative Ig domain
MPQLRAQCGIGSALPPPNIALSISPSPLVWGQAATVFVATSGPCGPATGAVGLEVDGEMVGNVYILDANGKATIPIPDPINGIPAPAVVFGSPGSHTIDVVYAGDTAGCGGIRSGGLGPRQCIQANYSPTDTFDTPQEIRVTVNKASTITSLTAATNGLSLTASVAAAAPGAGSPTGTVVFGLNGAALGTVAVISGQATLKVSSALLGLASASYSGDIDFNASNSAPLRIGPSPTASVTVTSSLNPSTVGQSVTFTASIAAANGLAPPSGTIQFSDGATPLGSPIPVVLSQASYTTSALTIGSHAISASYSGDSEFPSTAGNFGQVVNRLATTLTLSSSPSAPLSNQTVGIAAQLGPQAPTGLPGPTGQVTFNEGTNQLGVAAVASAAATGTIGPLSAGSHQITVVYAGDAIWSSASGTVTINVSPGPLTITTQTLPGATACSAYSATVVASGGAPPYTFSGTLPPNLTINGASGAISGSPQAAGKLTLTIQVTDSQKATVSQQFTIQAASGLTITTTTLPNGTTGSPYSASVVAACGTAPLTFSGTLPANLTINPASGAISGTPSVTGSQTIAISVKDSAGGSKNATYTVTFSVPAVPPLTITGGGGAGPGQQPAIIINLGAPFPVEIDGTLNLSFKAGQGGGDNPEVQFVKGGRVIPFTIPANSTTATFSISTLQVQTGTVAGTITIAANITGGNSNPVATETIVVPASPPSISVTAVHTSTGFTVTVTGFSTTLDMTQANFQFGAGSGTNLQTTSLSIPVSSLFSPYFQSGGLASGGSQTGSQFVYTQPFNVTGGGNITTVTVTMVNSNGTSAAATATIQ